MSIARCDCIKLLLERGYVQSNLLNQGQIFIYATYEGKVGKSPCLIKYCPICGKSIEPSVGGKNVT